MTTVRSGTGSGCGCAGGVAGRWLGSPKGAPAAIQANSVALSSGESLRSFNITGDSGPGGHGGIRLFCTAYLMPEAKRCTVSGLSKDKEEIPPVVWHDKQLVVMICSTCP